MVTRAWAGRLDPFQQVQLVDPFGIVGGTYQPGHGGEQTLKVCCRHPDRFEHTSILGADRDAGKHEPHWSATFFALLDEGR
jgi:hypothetical protein